MVWLGQGLEGLECTGEPVVASAVGGGYDGPKAKTVTIPCRVVGPPSAVPDRECAHEHFTLYGWASKPTQIADRRLELAPTFLSIERRRLHCKRCNAIVSERMPGVEIEHRMTRRLYDDVFHAAVNRTFEEAARLQGISPNLVRTIFRERARDLLGDFRPFLPAIIAIDETVIAGRQRFVCNCAVSRTLVEILPDKSDTAIEAFLMRNGSHGDVRVVIQDMNGNYRRLVRKVLGPQVAIVIDRFHVVEAINRAMNAARVAVTSTRSDEDKVVAVKRKGLRKLGPLFLKNRRDLTREELARLKEVLRAEPELKRAWVLKEDLKRLYRFHSAEAAAAHLDRIEARYDTRTSAVMKPMGAVIEMIQAYRTEILNWHWAFQDNASTEAMNRRYQQIDAGCSGLRFETVRAKALLRYGGILDDWYLQRL